MHVHVITNEVKVDALNLETNDVNLVKMTRVKF